MADIRIISTGSAGNCALLDECILIDLGVRKAEVPSDVMKRANALFITHEHGDHILPATLKWLYGERPDLVTRQTYMCGQVRDKLVALSGEGGVAAKVPQSNVIAAGDQFSIRTVKGKYSVEVFECPHGFRSSSDRTPIENVGFVFTAPSGEKTLWATDTMTMDFAPDEVYDCLCVEGNYDMRLLEAAMRDPILFERADRNRRHLSVQDFEKFVVGHSHDDTTVVQLHMSGDFGTLSSLNTLDMAHVYGERRMLGSRCS